MAEHFPPGAPHPDAYRDAAGGRDPVAWRAAVDVFMEQWRAEHRE